MAYIAETGEWLDFNARAAYLSRLKEERDILFKLVKANATVVEDIARLEWLLDEIERVETVHKGEFDVNIFGMDFASEDGNPGNDDNLIPAGVNAHNTAEIHRILCDMLNDVISGRATSHIAYACPRGHAKTAWLSNIFLLHQVVYRHQKYIVLVSETTDVAGDFIGWARFQLKHNQKLIEHFGPLLHAQASKNDTDNRYEFITKSGTKVEAKGNGTQMRGLRHGNSRPSLFILDDLESKESTNTPELIEKSKSWFSEEMLPALSRDGTCIYLGTILCYGSLLDYVIRERPDFKSRRFGAVKSFAKNESLWHEWRKLYREDRDDAPERARAFFEANEEAMLEGADVLWPGFWSYYDLMLKLEAGGSKAFAQEYQNEPTDEERQVFKEEDMIFFDPDELDQRNLRFYAAIDIAMGKTKGDYSVIASVARNVNTGRIYVWDLWYERVHPDKLIRVATEYATDYQYDLMGIETVFAQEFVADHLGRSLQDAGYPKQRLLYLKDRRKKEIRIEALQPDIQNGMIRFSTRIRHKLEQFTMYPMHPHDDVPDAVEMAIRTAKSGGGGAVRVTNRGSRWGNSITVGRR